MLVLRIVVEAFFSICTYLACFSVIIMIIIVQTVLRLFSLRVFTVIVYLYNIFIEFLNQIYLHIILGNKKK